MKNIIFYLGIGTFSTHELDAMTYHEWRVLPLTSWLHDEYGMLAFLFFHIPLFAILVALLSSSNEKIRYRSRVGISIFLIFHGLLHILFMGNANYEFSNIWSNILIFGGTAFGVTHLLLEYLEKQRLRT